MKTANRTDIGRIRTINEDRALVQPDLNGFALAIVADGMGGHKAGDIASSMAIELIESQLQTIHTGMTVEQFERTIKQAVVYANDKVYEFASRQDKFHGMGTTVVVALATREMIMLAHIGDSRAYLAHKQNIRQLTEDHSLVNELIKSGQISSEEAIRHPRRNVLTRALGTEPNVDVDFNQWLWQKGDILLLCTDGLSGLVFPDTMSTILQNKQLSLQQKADGLVERALQAGGDDNVTVALLANEDNRDEKR